MSDSDSDRPDAIEFDADDDAFRAWYEPERTAPSTAVVDVLRTVLETESTALEPLHAAIDPEALDAVLAPTGTRAGRRGRRTVTFRYLETDVTVCSDGRITVRSRSESPSDSGSNSKDSGSSSSSDSSSDSDEQ